MASSIRKSPKKAATYLVCCSSPPIVLEIESARKRIAAVAKKYSEWIGRQTKWPELEATRHALDVGSGKWGAEYRIYFPTDVALRKQLERYGYMVERGGVRLRGTLRINNEVLFRELVVQHGLVLGVNE